MSEFWKYFHDRLAWPLIHAPGPLSGLVRGLGLALDSARDDIVYFRRQWFPELCEADLVPDFGTGRGLARHPKETAEQFRARVVNAFRWHRLGGKTEGLPEILRFYGFDALTVENLRQYQPSRWAEFQLGLKTPATQAEQEALLADLDTLLWLVNEYKPARSVLARVYTDTYNHAPTVWSGGPVEEQGWSNGFWSLFSGVTRPGESGEIVVSFGMNHRCQSERYNETGAGLGVESRTGILAPYIDRPVWSRSAWSDVFPRNHGFTMGEIVSLHWCVRTTSSYPWHGAWDFRHWQEAAAWDRILPPWRFRWRSWARVEAVFSWPGDGKEPPQGGRRIRKPAELATAAQPGDPVNVHGDGTWGDINACYGRPRATIYQGTRWGDPWGADPERRELEILERRQDRGGLCTPAVHPARPLTAGRALLAAGSLPLCERGWRGPWSGRCWLAGRCPVGIAALRSVRAEHEDAGAPRLSGGALLTVPCAALSSPVPQRGGEDTAPVQAAPLREQGWRGEYNARRWYDYTGITSIKEQTGGSR